jgi:hypothetical protein
MRTPTRDSVILFLLLLYLNRDIQVCIPNSLRNEDRGIGVQVSAISRDLSLLHSTLTDTGTYLTSYKSSTRGCVLGGIATGA